MLEIMSFTKTDTDEVIELVLHCQNDGTRPFVSLKEQPELLNIQEEFIDNGGHFWVAKDHGKVVGSIGLLKLTDEIAVLKKFFVYEPYRSSPHHLGQRLYQEFINFIKERKIKTIILDTPKNTDRAHHFYEKAGFKKIKKEEIPIQYHYPYVDSDFFCLEIIY